MNESFPMPQNEEEKKKAQRNEYTAFAESLSQNNEQFPFPGIDPEFYAKTKEDETEFPGYMTPIDDLIERLKAEGCKVVVGKQKEVYVLPLTSNNIEEDGLFPRHLSTDAEMNDSIKKLIEMNKTLSNK